MNQGGQLDSRFFAPSTEFLDPLVKINNFVIERWSVVFAVADLGTGAWELRTLLSVQFLIFMQFLAKFMPDSRLVPLPLPGVGALNQIIDVFDIV